MNQLSRFSIIIFCVCVQTSATAQFTNVKKSETFKPHFGAGLSYRYPGPFAIATSFKPVYWIEAQLNLSYSSQKIGYKSQGRNQGYFGGLGLFFSSANSRRMDSRTNKFGFIWGMMYGAGKMNYYFTKQYPGGVFDDRFEDFESNRISFEYFDIKLGMEFILEDKFSIQVFPIQLGETHIYRKEKFPIPNSPALWENGIRPGLTVQYKFDSTL